MRASADNERVDEAALGVQAVIDRLAEAAEVLKVMRAAGVYPSERMGFWPPVVQNFYDAYGRVHDSERRPVPAVPSAAEITRADEAFRWLMVLDDDKRMLVWLRACGFKWRRLERHFGKVERHLRRGYLDAIEQIRGRVAIAERARRSAV